MNTAKYILACCTTAMLSLSASAQGPFDLLRISQQNYSFSTARSAALGGAFTALGADLSSMTINPAGLGLYRGVDIGITGVISSANMKSSFMGTSHSKSETVFSIGNIGGAFNLYQGDDALTSFTLGFGYNRLVDFNTLSYAAGSNASHSILNYYANQLNGIPESQLAYDPKNPSQLFGKFSTSMWGAILAYQHFLLEPIANNQYTPTTVLSPNAIINPGQRKRTEGSIGEYDISGGFNLQNIVYLGFTVGIQDLYYRNENDYTETYQNNTLALTDMRNIQRQRFDGTGVNFKFGIIVRPIDNLRIGLAIHTPTYMRINGEYIEYLDANVNRGMLNSTYAVNHFNTNTPTRFLSGISYTLPGIGLISADYERVWYSKMKLRNMGGFNEGYVDEVNAGVQEIFKPANNFRLGIETIPVKNFYLRAGYANYGNCMKHDDVIGSNTLGIKSYMSYSAGVGFRINSFYADLTYVYTDYKYIPYDLFYFNNGSVEVASDIVSPKSNRNSVLISVGMKF